MRLGDRVGEGHAKHSACPNALGFSSLCPSLSAGGKQEASDDREGKELMSQRSGH